MRVKVVSEFPEYIASFVSNELPAVVIVATPDDVGTHFHQTVLFAVEPGNDGSPASVVAPILVPKLVFWETKVADKKLSFAGGVGTVARRFAEFTAIQL
jgi:hypothetical protein